MVVVFKVQTFFFFDKPFNLRNDALILLFEALRRKKVQFPRPSMPFQSRAFSINTQFISQAITHNDPRGRVRKTKARKRRQKNEEQNHT